MLLVPVARLLANVASPGFTERHPVLARGATHAFGRVREGVRRRRNRAALIAMRDLDDRQLRDLGINRIALARATLAPRRCDPVAVLRREAGLR